MEQRETLEKIEMSLKKKEQEALHAKSKGMHTTYGNLLQEISLLKTKKKKLQMGSK